MRANVGEMLVLQDDDHSLGKIICDPIHGHIRVPSYCLEIIDTPEFQRLRDLKQLGVTQYIFPGAVHTRFEHCVGVSVLANKLIRQIKRRQPELHISDRDVRCVTLAGLCHDLGHGPFSHLFETWFRRQNLNFDHEIMSMRLLEYLVDENGIDIEREDIRFIQDLIRGQPRNAVSSAMEDRTWIYQIVANRHNSIDVDKWDYLARDCYSLGIKSSYDFSRLMKFNKVINGEISFHAKEAYNIYEMFHTRYSLFKLVYLHRVGKAIEYMLCDAFQLADEHMKIKERTQDIAEYSRLTDGILREIEFSKSPSLKASREIIRRLRKRDLYKMSYEALFHAQESELESIKSSDLIDAGLNLPPDLPRLSPGDVVVGSFDCNYAKLDKDPVQYVKFYNRQTDNVSFSLQKERVSLLIPYTFNEKCLRVYCTDASKVSSSRLAMRELLKSKNIQGQVVL